MIPHHGGIPVTVKDEWEEDCIRYRGRLLNGKNAHYCFDWDFLPIDETCREWPCGCREEELDEN